MSFSVVCDPVFTRNPLNSSEPAIFTGIKPILRVFDKSSYSNASGPTITTFWHLFLVIVQVRLGTRRCSKELWALLGTRILRVGCLSCRPTSCYKHWRGTKLANSSKNHRLNCCMASQFTRTSSCLLLSSPPIAKTDKSIVGHDQLAFCVVYEFEFYFHVLADCLLICWCWIFTCWMLSCQSTTEGTHRLTLTAFLCNKCTLFLDSTKREMSIHYTLY